MPTYSSAYSFCISLNFSIQPFTTIILFVFPKSSVTCFVNSTCPLVEVNFPANLEYGQTNCAFVYMRKQCPITYGLCPGIGAHKHPFPYTTSSHHDLRLFDLSHIQTFSRVSRLPNSVLCPILFKDFIKTAVQSVLQSFYQGNLECVSLKISLTPPPPPARLT